MTIGHGMRLPETTREEIARNLRAYRAGSSLSQAEVSEAMNALGFTSWRSSTVSLAEHGKRKVTTEEIVALARIFGTRPARLLSDY